MAEEIPLDTWTNELSSDTNPTFNRSSDTVRNRFRNPFKPTRIDIPEDDISIDIPENSVDIDPLLAGEGAITAGASGTSLASGTALAGVTIGGALIGGAILGGTKYLSDRNRGLTIPGTHYIGPGNAIDYAPPVNEADAIAQDHDIAYSKAKNPKDIEDADKIAIEKFSRDGNLHSLAGNVGLRIKQAIESKTGLLYPSITGTSTSNYTMGTTELVNLTQRTAIICCKTI